MRAGLTSLPALLDPLVRDFIISRAILRVPGNTVDTSRDRFRGVGEKLTGVRLLTANHAAVRMR